MNKYNTVQKDLPVWRELKLKRRSYSIHSTTCSERPSRLKGIETLIPRCSANWFREFRKTFPFEGNWNAIHCWLFISVLLICSERPSRLKGIETHMICQSECFPFPFRKTFPFEGNWNSDTSSVSALYCQRFRKTFPFEGNWNSGVAATAGIICTCSERPSRLKGIETEESMAGRKEKNSVQKDLPVWRELKH